MPGSGHHQAALLRGTQALSTPRSSGCRHRDGHTAAGECINRRSSGGDGPCPQWTGRVTVVNAHSVCVQDELRGATAVCTITPRRYEADPEESVCVVDGLCRSRTCCGLDGRGGGEPCKVTSFIIRKGTTLPIGVGLEGAFRLYADQRGRCVP